MFGAVVAEHANHSESKADGEACHDVSAVDVAVNEVRYRDSHSPEHENVYDGRVFYHAYTVDVIDDAVKDCIEPGERQYDADVGDCQRNNLWVLGKERDNGFCQCCND